MLKIEIIKDHEAPISRTINTRNGQKTIHEQTAYAHFGGAFPVEFKIPLDSPASAYPIGKYTLAPSSFQVNQYGSLEVNRFDMRLVQLKPAEAAPARAAS